MLNTSMRAVSNAVKPTKEPILTVLVDRANKFSPSGEDVFYSFWICNVQMDSRWRYESPHRTETFDRVALLKKMPISMREADDIRIGAPRHWNVRQELPDQRLYNNPEMTVDIERGAHNSET